MASGTSDPVHYESMMSFDFTEPLNALWCLSLWWFINCQ